MAEGSDNDKEKRQWQRECPFQSLKQHVHQNLSTRIESAL